LGTPSAVETWLAAGRDLLRRHPSVDIHAHPGRFFMRGARSTPFTEHFAAPFPERAVADMRVGGVSAALFATVADNAVLGFGPRGLSAQRDFAAGEAVADHGRQLDVLDTLIQTESLIRGGESRDIVAAHAAEDLACFASIEGGDFIEDKIERIGEAQRRGVRSITLIHYRTNQIGDTQTEPATHGGLSPLGREIVREMEAAGVLVDLAHASLDVTRDVAEMATRPVLLSHSNIAPPAGSHPRLVTADHARLVTATGGLIGVVPAGFAQSTFTDYIDTIMRMIDLLGSEHIAVGTDMDFTYRTVFPSYREWPAIPGALLARGLPEADVARVIGGNFLRILDTVSAASRS
jgi:membrane dipeptidase